MTIDEILAISDWSVKLVELKKDNFTDRADIDANIDYYNNIHPILSDSNRADYTIPIRNKAGTQTGTKTIVKSKIVLPIPRQIVATGDAMTFGEPVDLILNNDKDEANKEAFEQLVNVWKNADLDTFNHKLFKAVSVETKAAELLFADPEAENTEESIRAMLFSKESGDEIFPHFNDQRILDALTRVYKKRVLVGDQIEEIEVTEVYFAGGVWVRNGEKETFAIQALPYERMMIVYYDQLYSEWFWVSGLIDKLELIASQFSDVNKRLGNPSLLIQGKIKAMPDIEQDVKVWHTELSKDVDGKGVFGDVKLVESKAANESIKQEQDDLNEAVFKNTWPDLNKLMDEAATGNISIATMKLKFLNAFVKLGEKKPMYMEGLNTRIKNLKQMLFKITGSQAFLDLDISIKFNSILPDNVAEILTNIETAIQSGVLSKKSGVYQSPLSEGNEATVLDELEEEKGLEAGTVEI